jgi:hypothetical protein
VCPVSVAPRWRSGRSRAGCGSRIPTAGSSGTAGKVPVVASSGGLYMGNPPPLPVGRVHVLYEKREFGDRPVKKI